MKTATKAYTITVAGPTTITAYWTLDEVGNATRVDSVAGIQLLATGFNGKGSPALFSNGVEFDATSTGFQTFAPPQLAYTAPNSWSVWGWFKIVSTGTNVSFGGPYILAGIGNGATITLFAGSSTNPQPLTIYRNAIDNIDLACTLTDWHFFHLCYNGSTQKFGYSIDNAAVTYFPTVIALTNAGSGGITLGQTFVAGGDVLYDEIGVITTAMLTTAQQTALYNCGNGQTWPINLGLVPSCAPPCPGGQPAFYTLDPAFVGALNLYGSSATGVLAQTGPCSYAEFFNNGHAILGRIGVGYNFVLSIQVGGFNFSTWALNPTSTSSPIGSYDYVSGVTLPGFPPGHPIIS